VSEQPLPDQFRYFADGTEHDKAHTYTAICRGVADDPMVLALLAEAPLAQRRPNLLLAAVHFLLLGGAPHALAAHYDTVASFVPGPAPLPVGDVVSDFKAFCREYHDDLLALIATRSTQTNEVGRCSALLPALSAIAARHGDATPLSLLDLGTSAGLNLLYDDYRHVYHRRGGGPTVVAGDPTSEVILDCTVRNDLADLPPLRAPAMAERVGLDLSPIDPLSGDGARWLLACLWPDNLPRFTRLREALATARSTRHRPVLQQGDMVGDLGRVAGTIAPTAPLVIFHSWVAAYLTAARQGELVEAVRAVSGDRPVHYLYAESPVETPGLPTPPPPMSDAKSHLRTALVHVDLSDAGRPRPAVRLADMHAHGRWLHWWAT
jgi:hypothetical protein